ncbi:hypothetical protein HDU76_007022 [Blyttiomyces sp. JEL0837]|nr:hypothetical protein HDU76_007022 [Blyttiomyces sp. JEL0837]
MHSFSSEDTFRNRSVNRLPPAPWSPEGEILWNAAIHKPNITPPRSPERFGITSNSPLGGPIEVLPPSFHSYNLGQATGTIGASGSSTHSNPDVITPVSANSGTSGSGSSSSSPAGLAGLHARAMARGEEDMRLAPVAVGKGKQPAHSAVSSVGALVVPNVVDGRISPLRASHAPAVPSRLSIVTSNNGTADSQSETKPSMDAVEEEDEEEEEEENDKEKENKEDKVNAKGTPAGAVAVASVAVVKQIVRKESKETKTDVSVSVTQENDSDSESEVDFLEETPSKSSRPITPATSVSGRSGTSHRVPQSEYSAGSSKSKSSAGTSPKSWTNSPLVPDWGGRSVPPSPTPSTSSKTQQHQMNRRSLPPVQSSSITESDSRYNHVPNNNNKKEKKRPVSALEMGTPGIAGLASPAIQTPFSFSHSPTESNASTPTPQSASIFQKFKSMFRSSSRRSSSGGKSPVGNEKSHETLDSGNGWLHSSDMEMGAASSSSFVAGSVAGSVGSEFSSQSQAQSQAQSQRSGKRKKIAAPRVRGWKAGSAAANNNKNDQTKQVNSAVDIVGGGKKGGVKKGMHVANVFGTPDPEFGFRYEVLTPHIPDRGDEIELRAGQDACVFFVFEDSWALGRNLSTGMEGVFPLDCLRETFNPPTGPRTHLNTRPGKNGTTPTPEEDMVPRVPNTRFDSLPISGPSVAPVLRHSGELVSGVPLNVVITPSSEYVSQGLPCVVEESDDSGEREVPARAGAPEPEEVVEIGKEDAVKEEVKELEEKESSGGGGSEKSTGKDGSDNGNSNSNSNSSKENGITIVSPSTSGTSGSPPGPTPSTNSSSTIFNEGCGDGGNVVVQQVPEKSGVVVVDGVNVEGVFVGNGTVLGVADLQATK